MPNRSGSHGIFGPLLAPPLSTCPSLHLVHIPKNGGTAVEAHLHRFGCEVGFCRIAPLGWSSRENKCSYGSWWHMPTVFTSADLSKMKSVVVVRDPMERFISILNHNWKWHRPEQSRPPSQHRLVRRGEAPAPPPPPVRDEFDWVRGTPDSYIKYFLGGGRKNDYHPDGIRFDGDCHLLPQWPYLLDQYGNVVNHILHSHNLSDGLATYVATEAREANGWTDDFRTCSKAKISHLNVATAKPKMSGEKRHQLYSEKDLSPESLATIRSVYELDFLLAERKWDVHGNLPTLMKAAQRARVRARRVPIMPHRLALCAGNRVPWPPPAPAPPAGPHFRPLNRSRLQDPRGMLIDCCRPVSSRERLCPAEVARRRAAYNATIAAWARLG